nr:hypothetical protein [Actinacidiphila soli]
MHEPDPAHRIQRAKHCGRDLHHPLAGHPAVLGQVVGEGRA